MAIICWGSLAKSADDTTRIEQSIQHYVGTHDENPNAHMGEDYSLGGHRLQTELDHPPNSIHYFHVKDIHAEAITAGGLIVKGDGPYISVQDEAGAERVKIYPEGIIVNDGKIVVKNEDGFSQMDSKGLVGSNIFLSGQKSTKSFFGIPKVNKWYPIPSMEIGIYATRPVPIMIMPNISFMGSGSSVLPWMRLWHESEYVPNIDGWWWQSPDYRGNFSGFFNITRVISLHAGFNKIQAQMFHDRIGDSPSTLSVSDGENESGFGYMLMAS